MKKLIELFESVAMTAVGGVFLAVSLVLELLDIKLLIDPAWVPTIISGLPIAYSAVNQLITGKGISRISSAFLITSAIIAAAAIGDLFAAGEVAFIMAIGEILEDKTVSKAKNGLKSLIALKPETGRVVNNGTEELVAADRIKCGDILRVLPGERIPVDGEIIVGETTVDQSVMTGESLPVDKEVGDEVYCGCVNCFGAIDIKATRVGADGSLQKLIEMVRLADEKKAPMQRAADKWASYLVPVAFLIAVGTYFLLNDIVKAVTVLVVFCPCALVLATPTAIVAAIGQATKHGIVIKSGEALERMGKVNTVAFDKTGTLTHGQPTVSDVKVFASISEEELVSLAASAEQRSEHPLARAIVDYAVKNGIELAQPQNFRMTAGKGVSAVVSGRGILCGNRKYLKDIEISLEISAELDRLNEMGKATVIVASDGECIGVMALSDSMKDASKGAVSKLSAMKIESVLLTGDNGRAASYFADIAGIKSVYSELLPEDKVAVISNLKKESKIVCMIGDGVNDAPALKSADVGVAMGKVGSDLAAQAADIVLMGDDVAKLPYLKRLSNETVKTIKISIFLSLFINLVAIILSIAGLLTPVTGALVHNAGSCFVVLLAARLYDRKINE